MNSTLKTLIPAECEVAGLLFNQIIYSYMNNKIIKYNDDKATVCASNNCVTVYGDTARIINGMALIAVFLILLSLMSKASK